MPEYIDKQAFLDYMRGTNRYFTVKCDIESFPTADVVPIVRCKDCVYSQLRYGHLDCINGVSYRNTWNDPDMYCKYGVRRADNDKL